MFIFVLLLAVIVVAALEKNVPRERGRNRMQYNVNAGAACHHPLITNLAARRIDNEPMIDL